MLMQVRSGCEAPLSIFGLARALRQASVPGTAQPLQASSVFRSTKSAFVMFQINFLYVL